MEIRVGIGYDIHRLVEGRPFFLGGIEIPYVKGLLGHSDGDVLLHAVCDALLGAAGEGDIGEHFPDTDPAYEGIASIELLRKTFQIIKKKKFSISNIDAVIVAQEPCCKPFKKLMQAKIREALEIAAEDAVSVKAKTNNGLGAVGRKEAISCYATVLITKE